MGPERSTPPEKPASADSRVNWAVMQAAQRITEHNIETDYVDADASVAEEMGF